MQGRNKSNVLLTELVIGVLFFSLIAVTVVQMFVMAHQKGKMNAYAQRALIAAQDCAEVLSGRADLEQALFGAGYTRSEDGAYQQTRRRSGPDRSAVNTRREYGKGTPGRRGGSRGVCQRHKQSARGAGAAADMQLYTG